MDLSIKFQLTNCVITFLTIQIPQSSKSPKHKKINKHKAINIKIWQQSGKSIENSSKGKIITGIQYTSKSFTI